MIEHELHKYKVPNILALQSNPPNTAVLGTGEKPAVFRKRRYWESCKTNKNLIWDLKMSVGIEGEAVNGGAVLGGTTVYVPSKTTILLITDFR